MDVNYSQTDKFLNSKIYNSLNMAQKRAEAEQKNNISSDSKTTGQATNKDAEYIAFNKAQDASANYAKGLIMAKQNSSAQQSKETAEDNNKKDTETK